MFEGFDPEQLAAYRENWRQPESIHGFCGDYRAAASIDIEHDEVDIDRKLTCPILALWGSLGVMHKLFDMGAEWQARCENLQTATLPGGHFFIDQLPQETATIVGTFLSRNQ